MIVVIVTVLIAAVLVTGLAATGRASMRPPRSQHGSAVTAVPTRLDLYASVVSTNGFPFTDTEGTTSAGRHQPHNRAL